MKRLFLYFFLLLPLAATAAAPEGRVPKTRISSFISEYRHCEGVEVVRLGRVSTAALKGVIRVAARKENDPDARDFLKLMRNVNGLYVFDYEDCRPALRDKINRRLNRLLNNSDLLMEANDEGERMQIYGLYDERTEAVRDFVLFSPSDCALVCLFGSIPMDTVSSMLKKK
ncbi:MAG: DUF4252 domain-containing protein [Bacteroidales bacterium]|nr:DUF4252 domain-containing protein [Bacteroidales bacterium]